jgi:hypothetical protein
MTKKFLIVIFIVAGWPAVALAQQSGPQKSTKPPNSDKLLPLKGAARSNSCAEYGAGFVRVEGSDTCVKASGFLSIEAGARTGAR